MAPRTLTSGLRRSARVNSVKGKSEVKNAATVKAKVKVLRRKPYRVGLETADDALQSATAWDTSLLTGCDRVRITPQAALVLGSRAVPFRYTDEFVEEGVVGAKTDTPPEQPSAQLVLDIQDKQRNSIGLRAGEYIKKDSIIGVYTGHVRKVDADNVPGSYLLRGWWDTGKDTYVSTPYAIDSESEGNVTRFANSVCWPNAHFVFHANEASPRAGNLLRLPCPELRALRDIQRGEFINVCYRTLKPGPPTKLTRSQIKKEAAERIRDGDLTDRCACGYEYCQEFLWDRVPFIGA